jgi:hypothetical protein
VNQIIETLGESAGLFAVNGPPGTGKTARPAPDRIREVVASSSNGAVENVTNEIPGPKGIDDQWRSAAAAADYFRTTAGPGNWAIVAARLGNRTNRNSFVQDFWFSGEVSMRAVLKPRRPWWTGTAP